MKCCRVYFKVITQNVPSNHFEGLPSIEHNKGIDHMVH